MPSYEEVSRLTSQRKVPISIQNIKVFLIFVCPICDAYTIHKPRLNAAGYWYVDHTRVRAFQMDFDGNEYEAGFSPLESCFVDDNLAIANIEKTRTVIRVK